MPFTPQVASQENPWLFVADSVKDISKIAAQAYVDYSASVKTGDHLNKMKDGYSSVISAAPIDEKTKEAFVAELAPTDAEKENPELYDKRIAPLVANVYYYQKFGNGAPITSADFKQPMQTFQEQIKSLSATKAAAAESTRLFGQQQSPTSGLDMGTPATQPPAGNLVMADAGGAAARVAGTPPSTPMDSLSSGTTQYAPEVNKAMDTIRGGIANNENPDISPDPSSFEQETSSIASKPSTPMDALSIPGAAQYQAQGGFDPANPVETGVQQIQQQQEAEKPRAIGAFDSIFSFAAKDEEFAPLVEATRQHLVARLSDSDKPMSPQEAQDYVDKTAKELGQQMRRKKEVDDLVAERARMAAERLALDKDKADQANATKKYVAAQKPKNDGGMTLNQALTRVQAATNSLNSIITNRNASDPIKYNTALIQAQQMYSDALNEYEQVKKKVGSEPTPQVPSVSFNYGDQEGGNSSTGAPKSKFTILSNK
jgi:hypothetical protein